MSGRINLSNLSDSLKEHLNGLGLTEEQVNELIENALVEINEKNVEQDEVVNGLVDKVGELNGLMTEEKGDLVGAINELFQSANNGKELIANAIGEPLSSEDTFSAMSNDINSLLSTFKTNMMNNGITVESSDRFKSLIDKIATLADNEGKGVQFASGQISAPQRYTFANTSATHTFNFGEPLNFTPTYLFIRIPDVSYSSTNGSGEAINAIVSNLFNNIYEGNDWANQFRVGCVSSEGVLNIKSVSTTGFVMEGDTNITFGCATSSDYYGTDGVIDWYAIGIGEVEEDNTLRDSLASILTEEGVSVTEEDDMASLITKVDEEFDNQVVPAGDAVAADVISGKTFINSTGSTITGTMVNQGGTQTITPGTSNQTLSAGYYSGDITVSGDANLIASNIVSGKNIFGVAGTAQIVTNNIVKSNIAGGSSTTYYDDTWTTMTISYDSYGLKPNFVLVVLSLAIDSYSLVYSVNSSINFSKSTSTNIPLASGSFDCYITDITTTKLTLNLKYNTSGSSYKTMTLSVYGYLFY